MDGLDPTGESSSQEAIVTYVEFYSGIGGWTMALHEALDRMAAKDIAPFRLQRLAALDHSDLCHSVFHHNFPPQAKENKKRKRMDKTVSVEQLTQAQVEDWNAMVWTMSPPCQPHTRQHTHQKEDLEDPRSRSFLNLCQLLENMDEAKLPRVILMENVVGFELVRRCYFSDYCSCYFPRNSPTLTFYGILLSLVVNRINSQEVVNDGGRSCLRGTTCLHTFI